MESDNTRVLWCTQACMDAWSRITRGGWSTYSDLSHSMYDTQPNEMTKKKESRESKSRLAFGSYKIAITAVFTLMVNSAEPSKPDTARAPPLGEDRTADTAVKMSEMPLPRASNVTPATT